MIKYIFLYYNYIQYKSFYTESVILIYYIINNIIFSIFNICN